MCCGRLEPQSFDAAQKHFGTFNLIIVGGVSLIRVRGLECFVLSRGQEDRFPSFYVLDQRDRQVCLRNMDNQMCKRMSTGNNESHLKGIGFA